ncbi:MAG: hypothetical protein JWO02_3223, partial [Solirubrobacterales bacterium]|nr:hypothetical protein [Solirubrobacterales bacterium]
MRIPDAAHRRFSGTRRTIWGAAIAAAFAGAWIGHGDGPAKPSTSVAAAQTEPVIWRADAERPLPDEWASMATSDSCAQLSRPTDKRFSRVRFPVAQGSYAYRSEVRDGD